MENYERHLKKSWEHYVKLFEKYGLGSHLKELHYSEWPQEVKDAYENHRYQFELNSLCEIDMAEYTKWVK